MFNWLYTAVSWVLLQWHHLFTWLGMDAASGLNWALSIVFLVITARLLLFRLFIKQVKYQRHMQTVQPKIQALRKKYKDDRAELQRQMMKLQQEEGFNPLAGCLPMFLQLPVFWGLFHTLRHLSNSVYSCVNDLADPHLKLYGFAVTETCNAAQANIFGAPLAGQLTQPDRIIDLGGEVTTTRIVILILVLVSAGATFTTQLLVRRAQVTPPEGTAATIQRLMLFGIPLGTLGSGLFFPLGVLLYWFTSNTWTMAQQMYINKFHPQVTPEDAKPAGPSRAVTPRPGQRPVRPGRGAPQGSPRGTTSQTLEPPGSSGGGDDLDGASQPGVDAADDGAPGAGGSVGGPGRVTPRPGQRPQRPNRPPAKRTNKAKKRR